MLLFILLNATLVAVFLGPTEIDLDDIMYVIFVVLGFCEYDRSGLRIWYLHYIILVLVGWTYMQTVLFTYRERIKQSGIRA